MLLMNNTDSIGSMTRFRESTVPSEKSAYGWRRKAPDSLHFVYYKCDFIRVSMGQNSTVILVTYLKIVP